MALYDGSKKDLKALALHLWKLSSLVETVLKSKFILLFHNQPYVFLTSRELHCFSCGLFYGTEAPYVEKMEQHISGIVSSVFKLDEIEKLEITDDDDPTT